MKYCHVNHVVHRDLKPENVLFQTPDFDSPIAIIDFGTSRYYSPQEAMEKRVGTLHYLAPEVFQGKYDKKCDVWSCGVMLYIMLCG